MHVIATVGQVYQVDVILAVFGSLSQRKHTLNLHKQLPQVLFSFLKEI